MKLPRVADAQCLSYTMGVTAKPARLHQSDPERGRPSLDRLLAQRADFVAYLRRRLGNAALAEDLVQESLARAVDRVDSVRPDALMAWFYRVLRNAAVDHQRRARVAQQALAGYAAEPVAATEPDAQPCRCVGRLVEALTPEHAQALRRIEVEGASMKQLATEAGIATGTAAVRVFRARQALEQRVKKTCGACASLGCQNCTCGDTMTQPLETNLFVTGMTCGACVRHVEGALRGIAGVGTVEVSLQAGTARVQHDGTTPIAALLSAVEDAGYEAKPA